MILMCLLRQPQKPLCIYSILCPLAESTRLIHKNNRLTCSQYIIALQADTERGGDNAEAG